MADLLHSLALTNVSRQNIINIPNFFIRFEEIVMIRPFREFLQEVLGQGDTNDYVQLAII